MNNAPGRIFALLLSIPLTISLTACAGGSASQTSTPAPTPPAGATSPTPTPSPMATPTPTATPTPMPSSGFTVKNFPLPFAGFAQLAVADFDHDGHPDLLIFDQSIPISVALNDGQGNFKTPVALLGADYNHGVAIADFNGDGIPDVAACVTGKPVREPDPPVLTIFLNDGKGTFTKSESKTINCSALLAGDVDHDGNTDMVVFTPIQTPPNNVTITTYFGDGHGHLSGRTAQQSIGLFAEGGELDNPCLLGGTMGGDFSGDGSFDLLLSGACVSTTPQGRLQGGTLHLAKSQGNGQFVLSRLASKYGYGIPLARDFNHDGRLDALLVGNYFTLAGDTTTGSDHVELAMNQGRGMFAFDTAFSGTFSYSAQTNTGTQLCGATTADTAGTGATDLVVCSTTGGVPSTYNYSVLKGSPGGSYTPGQSWSRNDSPLWGLVAADFDGDGRDDLAGIVEKAVPGGGVPEFDLVLYLSKK